MAGNDFTYHLKIDTSILDNWVEDKLIPAIKEACNGGEGKLVIDLRTNDEEEGTPA